MSLPPYSFAGLINIRTQPPTMFEIVKIVAEHYKIPVAIIFKRSRGKGIIPYRQISQYLLKRKGYTSVAIADYFNYHHSTILNNITTIENRIDTEEDMKNNIQNIILKLQLKDGKE